MTTRAARFDRMFPETFATGFVRRAADDLRFAVKICETAPAAEQELTPEQLDRLRDLVRQVVAFAAECPRGAGRHQLPEFK